MTRLSINLNKLALLRNSRGRNYPDLLAFAERFIAMGVRGLTVHPRPDERHVTRRDVYELAALVAAHPGVEFNVEGYPSPAFMELMRDNRPDQCTLVPDAPGQLTSDHGWDCARQADELAPVLAELRELGIRSSLFLEPSVEQVALAAKTGADRIELYTEHYAKAFGTPEADRVLAQYRAATQRATALGLGVNAGHDLDLRNLPAFLCIPGILEVSIGHALTVECFEQGMELVVPRYLDICKNPEKFI